MNRQISVRRASGFVLTGKPETEDSCPIVDNTDAAVSTFPASVSSNLSVPRSPIHDLVNAKRFRYSRRGILEALHKGTSHLILVGEAAVSSNPEIALQAAAIHYSRAPAGWFASVGLGDLTDKLGPAARRAYCLRVASARSDSFLMSPERQVIPRLLQLFPPRSCIRISPVSPLAKITLTRRTTHLPAGIIVIRHAPP